jgi:UDP-hydrolysing UDP-N-acetyl-D-glucosamine 2-epimerase
MAKKKICIVTTSRAEYGVIRWLIDDVNKNVFFELQLVVTGSHLSPEFGSTYKEIEKDGFIINEKIEMLLSSLSTTGIAKSMGVCTFGFCDAFERLKPDLLIVTGDRYELLPICSTAVVMNIPIAHISGGDVTIGAIDNQIRNAITAMSIYHFPGTVDSGNRIIRMGVNPDYVFVVGEPALDNFNRLKILSRKKISEKFGLSIEKKWILLTYHPETKLSLEKNLLVIKNIIQCLKKINNTQVIITKANADYGGVQINDYLKNEVLENNSTLFLYDNLGQLNYISLMKEIVCMIGNSSSGIIEAPSIKCPVINIGNRQKGRILSNNIISCKGTTEEITCAIQKLTSTDFFEKLKNTKTPHGKGHSTELIIQKLKQIILYD